LKTQILISIGREHGSGGHVIAQMIAERLNIRLYDKEILEEIVNSSGYSRELVAKMDEKPVNLFSSRRIGGFSNSLEFNVAEKTFEFIQSQADSGESFVIVGRCAEQVLRGNPNYLRFFIRGEMHDKIRRVAANDRVSEKDAVQLIRETDRRRKAYHNYYCDCKWGDARGYDLTVNSDRLGIPQTVEVLVQYIRAFMEQ